MIRVARKTWFGSRTLSQKINSYLLLGVFVPFVLMSFFLTQVSTWQMTRRRQVIEVSGLPGSQPAVERSEGFRLGIADASGITICATRDDNIGDSVTVSDV